jgi:hypothetical protein
LGPVGEPAKGPGCIFRQCQWLRRSRANPNRNLYAYTFLVQALAPCSARRCQFSRRKRLPYAAYLARKPRRRASSKKKRKMHAEKSM